MNRHSSSKRTARSMTTGGAVALLAVGLLAAGPAVADTADVDIPAGAWIDEFDSTTLDPAWSIIGESASDWSLTSTPGRLDIETLTGDTYQDSNSAQNIFMVDIPDADFTAITQVDLSVSAQFQGAGLIAWSDIDNYVRYGVTYVGDLSTEANIVLETDVETDQVFSAEPFTPREGSTGEVLRIQRVDDTVTTSYWVDGAWVEAASMDITFPITQVGLYGLASQAGASMTASFDYFALDAAEGEDLVPEAPFVLEADRAPRHVAIVDGTVTLSETRPSSLVRFVPTAAGEGAVTLATADGDPFVVEGGVITVGGSGEAATAMRITDAGGGKVTLRLASATGDDGFFGVDGGDLVSGLRDNASLFTVTDSPLASDAAELRVDGGETSVEMSEDLYGVFYEDINYAADGGLYAELVRNRSFEFNSSDNGGFTGLTGWSAAGGASLSVVNDNGRLNDMNRNYLAMTAPGSGAAVVNASYNEGVALEDGSLYDFSVWARAAAAQDLQVRLTNSGADTTYATGTVAVDGSNEWKQYEVTLEANDTTNAARLRVETTAAGTVNLDMVSLFPQDQYVGAVNGTYGMRKDLAERMEALDPSFLRFPGGCVTNVGTFESYEESGFTDRQRTYQWKETIGPVEERPTNWNFWGYNQSYGLGYYEYFLLAEDMDAFALPVVSVGANGCGSNIPQLTDQNSALFQRWVDDTVDLVEFAIGDVTTEWGAVRAELGHPEPFDMPYIGLGNEENTTVFEANFPIFRDAIEAEFPEVTIISNTGPDDEGGRFNTLWDYNRQQDVAMVDEHYYNDPAWFFDNTNRYDSYDREGPHVFLGEYASRGNAMRNALAEAAYMTGLERNSDLVELASYAPLYANEDYVQWSPDAIWFDNDESWGSVNYWVQHMFSNNRGDQIVPSTLAQPTTGAPDLSGGVLLSTWETAASYDDVTVTGADEGVLFADSFDVDASDWSATAGTWSVADGRYAQTSTTATDARTVVSGSYGNDWSNYTLELTATKQAGNEGFLVGFAAGSSDDYYWWNLGGWGNTRSVLERATGGSRGPVAEGLGTTIVTGQEYDIRIEIDGRHVDLYLDDVLQFSYDEPVASDVYQVVTRDTEAQQIIVKAVNASDAASPVDIVVEDVTISPEGATVLEMVGPSQGATNTKADPDAIVPVESPLAGVSNDFRYELPARSISFLRLPYDSTTPPPPVLESIEVTQLPTTTDYVVGDVLDLDGLEVTGTWTDSTTEVLTADEFTVSGFDSSVAATVMVSVTSTEDASVTTSFTVTVAEEPAPVEFVDIEGNEHAAAIEWLAAQGISTGWETENGTQFRPFNSITRDAMAAFLYRYAGSPEVTLPAQSPFVDADESLEHYEAIVWLAQEGISEGWDTNAGQEFRPFEPITRDAMAAFLYRLADEPTWVDPVNSPFVDITSTNTEFYTEITWLEDTGITNGWETATGTEFRPFNETTRDAMAAFLYRYDQLDN
ncbi:alpha-L-arabinofuranosidase C-terminal domain-containing protein [Demequina sp. SO4-13]|uniref:alpha-L-arabinofuranosidase C-terminal domain-containing protein n=1 Tax=Demequina sp. SO4-13 TaxID=3401027 RepID=UPI003AF5F441